jgi:hypothetical protein
MKIGTKGEKKGFEAFKLGVMLRELRHKNKLT